jgi:hypothetical protein
VIRPDPLLKVYSSSDEGGVSRVWKSNIPNSMPSPPSLTTTFWHLPSSAMPAFQAANVSCFLSAYVGILEATFCVLLSGHGFRLLADPTAPFASKGSLERVLHDAV